MIIIIVFGMAQNYSTIFNSTKFYLLFFDAQGLCSEVRLTLKLQ